MKSLFNVAVAVLSISHCLLCQTAPSPLPPKWLHDGHPVVPELNFSINSPRPDSQWSYQVFPKVDGYAATAFIVDAAADAKYMLMVLNTYGSKGSWNTKTFSEHMQRSLPKDWQLLSVQAESTDIPLKGSTEFKATLRLPNDIPFYAYGYIAPRNHFYEIVAYTADTAEPIPFQHFVQSFTLLSPEDNTPPPNYMGLSFFGRFGVLSWIGDTSGGAG